MLWIHSLWSKFMPSSILQPLVETCICSGLKAYFTLWNCQYKANGSAFAVQAGSKCPLPASLCIALFIIYIIHCFI